MAVGIGVIVGTGEGVGIGVAVGRGVGKAFAATVGKAESASLMRSLTNSSFSLLEVAQATDSSTMLDNRHNGTHFSRSIILYLTEYPSRRFDPASSL